MCQKRPFWKTSNESVQRLITEEMHSERLRDLTRKVTVGERIERYHRAMGKKEKGCYECPRTGYCVPAICEIDSCRILGLFSTLSSWELVYTNKSENSIWEYTNGSCLRGPHRSNRWAAPALNILLMYCQGFSHVAQFTSWKDLYTPISQELKLLRFSCPCSSKNVP